MIIKIYTHPSVTLEPKDEAGQVEFLKHKLFCHITSFSPPALVAHFEEVQNEN